MMNIENNFGFEAVTLLKSAENLVLTTGKKTLYPSHIMFSILQDEYSLIGRIFGELKKMDTDSFIKELAVLIQSFPASDERYSPDTLTILNAAMKHSIDKKLFINTEDEGKATSVGLFLAIIKTKTELSPLFSKYGATYTKLKSLIELYLSEENEAMQQEEPFMVIEPQHAHNVPELGQRQQKRKNGALESYCENLNEHARKTDIKCYGREKEVGSLITTLNNKNKRNALLVGKPGVGKTVIVEHLADLINKGKVPVLKNKEIYSLNLNDMVSGTIYRGMFEERMKSLMDEISGKDVILFIDEAHAARNAGNGSSDVNLFNVLKPKMARGEVQIILCTTLDEHRIIEQDKAFLRRCNVINVEELSADMTLNILKDISPAFEAHHNVSYTYKALAACVELSERFMGDRTQPDKSIDIMDEIGSSIKVSPPLNSGAATWGVKLNSLFNKKIHIRDIGAYEEAPAILFEEKQLLGKMHRATSKKSIVDEEQVFNYFATTHNINFKQAIDISEIKSILNNTIIGQTNAINTLLDGYEVAQLGLDDNPTKGNMFFIGQTGVGKTETAKQMAKILFHNNIFIVDCSEYRDRYSINKLIGADPGFIGYDKGGLLIEFQKHHPEAVYLFDEIEKGGEELHDIMLQMMGDGRLTDSKGHIANFKNSLIILTSNIGINGLSKKSSLGYTKATPTDFKENEIMKAVEARFKPEFCNRIDSFVYFNDLTKTDIEKIYDIYFEKLKTKVLATTGRTIINDENVKERIINMSLEENRGARPLKRNFNKYAIKELLAL